ncbi:hypothetical protein BD626DRAFT_494561 [Schizophyllum amplum]|uniref:F-box domain-containing protein n=1 Tax=Schizophyllum amplum TaxID=97359 RepID=A0A550CFD4_9AGAR|nr:hypothetical protein BD626DRAFT_494561 [Auriculariopsis ampla]
MAAVLRPMAHAFPTESPYGHVLHTNYIPTDVEVVDIHALCSAPAARMTTLEAEITQLRDTIARKLAELQALATFTTAHRALTSGMRRLPAEILQTIFVACLPTDGPAAMADNEAPLVLTRVCRRWRRIAYGTAELWASIHIACPDPRGLSPLDPPSVSLAERLRLAAAWLARSGTCPLDISLFSGEGARPVPASQSPACAFAELLRPHASRIRHLRLTLPAAALDTVRAVCAEARYLRSCDVYVRPDPLLDAAASTDVALSSESVRTLRLALPSPFSAPEGVWGRLRDLTLCVQTGDVGTRALLNNLPLCTELEVCRLVLILPFASAATPLVPAGTTLPRLRTLCIEGVGPLSSALDALTLPALKSLSLQSDTPTGTHASLRRLLERSRCEVTRLQVTAPPSPHDEVAGCLRLAPALEELVLHERSAMRHAPAGESSTFVDALADANALCPALRDVRLSYCTAVTPEHGLQLLKRRNGRELGCVPLQTLHLSLLDLRQAEFGAAKEMMGWRQRGVDVVVTPSSPRYSYSPKEGLRERGSISSAFGEMVW